MTILWRLTLGFGLVLLALWVIVGEQLAGVSADATINARLVTVRSATAGDLTLPTRTLGSSVGEGEALGVVEDPLVDGVRQDDLLAEVAFARAAMAREAAMRDETAAIIAALTDRATVFRAHRIAEIEARLAFAEERLALLEAGGLPEGFDIAPPQDAGIDRAAAQEAAGIRVLWINAVRERIAVLENERIAAEAGVFLGDGYNDAPNAGQRIVELQSELAAHEARFAEAEARHAAFADRLAAERLRTSRAGRSEVRTPVAGRLWEVLQADGVNVQRGDPVLRVLDCGSVIVTASVTEHVYNRLVVGQEAIFRLSDRSRTFGATVIRLAGAGAATVYNHLAIAPSGRHLERYDVALAVPGLAEDRELACAVGRTGRVFFERRPLDLVRDLGL